MDRPTGSVATAIISRKGPKTNAYRALVDLRAWTCGFISRADVADFLVKQIDDDAFLHKTPVLTPPRGASRGSTRGAAGFVLTMRFPPETARPERINDSSPAATGEAGK